MFKKGQLQVAEARKGCELEGKGCYNYNQDFLSCFVAKYRKFNKSANKVPQKTKLSGLYIPAHHFNPLFLHHAMKGEHGQMKLKDTVSKKFVAEHQLLRHGDYNIYDMYKDMFLVFPTYSWNQAKEDCREFRDYNKLIKKAQQIFLKGRFSFKY